MSVRCNDCGAIASYGNEIGHKSDCPALVRAARLGRLFKNMPKGDDSNCTTGPMFETEEEAAEAADNGRNTGGKSYLRKP